MYYMYLGSVRSGRDPTVTLDSTVQQKQAKLVAEAQATHATVMQDDWSLMNRGKPTKRLVMSLYHVTKQAEALYPKAY